MYEELYEKLPDANRYWDKLGLSRPEAPLSKDDLDRIIFAHQSRIPFENLDVCDFHRTIKLGIPDLFEKIIVGNRGGYCFELNALLDALLQDAGVKTMACLGRSLKDRGYVYPILHRGIIVTLGDERYIAEVGYGGPTPACATPLVDGAELESCGQVFRVELHDGGWWHVIYRGTAARLAAARERGEDVAPTPVFALLDAPAALTDCVPLSYYCSTHPDSVFTQWRMVNRRTEDGNVSITKDQFVRVTPEGKETRTVESEEEFRALLEEHFGIVLPA